MALIPVHQVKILVMASARQISPTTLDLFFKNCSRFLQACSPTTFSRPLRVLHQLPPPLAAPLSTASPPASPEDRRRKRRRCYAAREGQIQIAAVTKRKRRQTRRRRRRRRATRRIWRAQETNPPGPGPAAHHEPVSSNCNIPTANVTVVNPSHILRLGTGWETLVLQGERIARQARAGENLLQGMMDPPTFQ